MNLMLSWVNDVVQIGSKGSYDAELMLMGILGWLSSIRMPYLYSRPGRRRSPGPSPDPRVEFLILNLMLYIKAKYARETTKYHMLEYEGV